MEAQLFECFELVQARVPRVENPRELVQFGARLMHLLQIPFKRIPGVESDLPHRRFEILNEKLGFRPNYLFLIKLQLCARDV